MQHLPDFPPLPDCFSHLVISTDGDPRSFRSQLSQFTSGSTTSETPSLSRFSCRPKGLPRSDAFDEFDHYIMNGTRSNLSCVSVHQDEYDSEQLLISLSSQSVSKSNVQPQSALTQQSAADTADSVTDQKNPFMKLQESILKLQREMKDLRYLDISLFCQLLSLHEAVQEYKTTIADRFSETGSEYSLGSASYMGSMSSLNDDSEWGEDGTLLMSSHEQLDTSELGENSQSASSLLKQITELVLRADNDF